jgi:hypothetical protein
MVQGRQISMHESTPAVWLRRSAAISGVLAVAAALLIVHFYVGRITVTLTSVALGICLLYTAFGAFKLEALIEAVAFGVALIVLVVLGLVALASGRETWAVVAAACMIPIGIGLFKIAAQNLALSQDRQSDLTGIDNTSATLSSGRSSSRTPRPSPPPRDTARR